jgi:hypothetical protein
VWGGTYFPKTSRYGRPAFVDVLREVSRLFREEPDKIEQNRDALMQRLSAHACGPPAASPSARQGTRPRRAQLGGAIDRCMAACAAPEISASAISSFCGARAAARHRAPTRQPLTSAPSVADARHASARAASTIISAAASRAIRSTSAGWSRISRRCSTTMRSCSSCLRSPCAKPAIRSTASGRRKLSAWLAREMTTPGGRVLRLARCRFRRRGGQVLRLVARRDRGRRLATGRLSLLRRALRRDTAGQLRRPQYSQPPQARAWGAKSSMTDDEARLAMLRAKLLAAREAACGPASTTRCWRTGTG